ncbi:MAG: transketolase family protein [Christensenellaceae bacterium]|jgi:transketolase|nr:transketolase family protein [Christensenellaceae bacterium]
MAVEITAAESTKLATAEIFGRTIAELGEKDSRIVCLSPDLQSSTKMGDFFKKFPERFYNVGIAEQNMVGIAAGLARAGMVAFASCFSVFMSLRCLDQVHTDVCYQNVDVKLIATHGGTSYGPAGSTHHAIEDLGVIRTLVNMTLICPADGLETANAVKAAAATPGPFYIRINRGFDNTVYRNPDYGFQVGKAVTMAEGNDLTIIACGSCVYEAIQAASILKAEQGINARVLNMHTIKPIDTEAIHKAIDETHRIITVEDHTIIGGLGSAVAEVIADYGKAAAFLRLGIPDKWSPIGAPEDLRAYHKIDSAGIAASGSEILNKTVETGGGNGIDAGAITQSVLEVIKSALTVAKRTLKPGDKWDDEV